LGEHSPQARLDVIEMGRHGFFGDSRIVVSQGIQNSPMVHQGLFAHLSQTTRPGAAEKPQAVGAFQELGEQRVIRSFADGIVEFDIQVAEPIWEFHEPGEIH
jgi:hypothetical protein